MAFWLIGKMTTYFPTGYVRDIHDKISWESRLTAILGARGVGKSTLVLQHIKLYEDAATTLYVLADDLYFSMHTLVELAGQFYRDGGKVLYFISTRYTNIRTGHRDQEYLRHLCDATRGLYGFVHL